MRGVSGAYVKILILSDHPISAEGLASVLAQQIPGSATECCWKLEDAFTTLGAEDPAGRDSSVLIVDCGTLPSLAALRELLRLCGAIPLVLWGIPPREFTVQAVHAGVRGVVSKCDSVAVVVEAITEIVAGKRWFEQEVLDSCLSAKPVALTRREAQLVSLISQGLRNKEAAHIMGITEGTVKVYLSRLFRRLNVSDRLELALYGLKNLNMTPSGATKPPLVTGPVEKREMTCLNTIMVH